MAYNTNEILRDVNGAPIPQYYDEEADIYKPLEKGEYVWLNTDTAPVLDSTDRVFGAEIDTNTNTLNVKYWNGTTWVVVE